MTKNFLFGIIISNIVLFKIKFMNKTIFFSIIASIFLLSCNKQQLNATTHKNNIMPPKDSLTAQVLKYGMSGGSGNQEIKLINDSDTFSFLWAKRSATVSPQPETPSIDFNKKSVILIDFHKSNSGVPEESLKNITCEKDTCTINLVVPPVDFTKPVAMVIVKDYMFIVSDKIKDNTNFKLKFTNP